MEIALKILSIDGINDISHYELMVDDVNHRFHSKISYKIHTIHDFLFGETKILIISNGFLFTNLRGLSVIRNNLIIKQHDELRLNILDAAFLYKTDYFTDLSLHHKGKIKLSYTIKYVEEDLEYQLAKNSFVYKAVDLLLAPKRSSLVKNLKNLIDEAAKGSPKCKMNILFGVYQIDKFMTDLNHRLTSNIDIKSLQHLNACIVEKRLFPSPKFNYNDLEGVVLRNKYRYSLQSISMIHCKDKFKIIKVEKPISIKKRNMNDFKIVNEPDLKANIHSGSNNTTEKTNNYSFKSLLKFIFSKESSEQEESIKQLDELDILGDSTIIDDTAPSIYNKPISKKLIKKLQIKEKFRHNIHLYLKPKDITLRSIEDLLSNDDYICAHKFFIDELLNVFYYALGPYGNTWPTTFLERRAKSKVIDPHRKAILEILNIQEDCLLVSCFGDVDIPDFIIFFDKKEKRLVLSFKGTSTSDETLHDLDCEYTSFYEGLTHKGIKRLAVAFIENKIEEIIILLKLYDTNELLITGHSLGGSLASIITIIIHREGFLKNVKLTTIAFSPAPIVSYNIIGSYSIFTVNYGNDVIPRLCYGSVFEMRYVCCSLGSKDNNLDDIRRHLNQTQLFPKLYHPGKAYQLRRIKTVKKEKVLSVLLYKRVEPDYYEDLLIVKHSPKHHMINHISNVLRECSKDYPEISKL